MRDPTPESRLAALSNKPLMLLALVILLIGIACAWWFQSTRQAEAAAHPETALLRGIEESRVLLADAFRSYDSETAITTTLEAAGLSIQHKVLERPPNPRHPPRRIATFTIDGYRHLDCEGTLVLEFFNDRLMEADFRPDDAARYSPRLHRTYPALARDRTGHAEYVATPLRIWSSVDLAKSKVGRALGTDGVVLWQDLRLIAQRDDWDARFGSIPVPFNP